MTQRERLQPEPHGRVAGALVIPEARVDVADGARLPRHDHLPGQRLQVTGLAESKLIVSHHAAIVTRPPGNFAAPRRYPITGIMGQRS